MVIIYTRIVIVYTIFTERKERFMLLYSNEFTDYFTSLLF